MSEGLAIDPQIKIKNSRTVMVVRCLRGYRLDVIIIDQQLDV